MPSEGPLFGTVASTEAAGSVAWTEPAEALDADGSAAAALSTDSGGVLSERLKLQTFGFAIPAGATIDGIVVEVNCALTNDQSIGDFDEVRLIGPAGTLVGDDKGTGQSPPTLHPAYSYLTFGGAVDAWNASLTAADVNDADFGVAIVVLAGTLDIGSGGVHIDGVRITVHYTGTSGQKAYATSTVTVNGWLTDLGGTNLHTAIDETTASDADYIQSALSPSSADICEVAFGSLIDPQSSVSHFVRYRYLKSTTGGDQINLTVRLIQGTTEIASWTHTNIDAVTTATQTLSAAQADSITNYGDLRLRFEAVKV